MPKFVVHIKSLSIIPAIKLKMLLIYGYLTFELSSMIVFHQSSSLSKATDISTDLLTFFIVLKTNLIFQFDPAGVNLRPFNFCILLSIRGN